MSSDLLCEECNSLKFRSKRGLVCISCFQPPADGSWYPEEQGMAENQNEGGQTVNGGDDAK